MGKLLKVTNLGLSLLHPIPNYLESFPTKIFEYYLNEVPVISSNFPYLTDIVKKDNCGIMVDPTDVDAIAGAIEFFINNPLKAKKMANNGFQLVTTKYNWQSEEKRLLATYNNFVA